MAEAREFLVNYLEVSGGFALPGLLAIVLCHLLMFLDACGKIRLWGRGAFRILFVGSLFLVIVALVPAMLASMLMITFPVYVCAQLSFMQLVWYAFVRAAFTGVRVKRQPPGSPQQFRERVQKTRQLTFTGALGHLCLSGMLCALLYPVAKFLLGNVGSLAIQDPRQGLILLLAPLVILLIALIFAPFLVIAFGWYVVLAALWLCFYALLCALLGVNCVLRYLRLGLLTKGKAVAFSLLQLVPPVGAVVLLILYFKNRKQGLAVA